MMVALVAFLILLGLSALLVVFIGRRSSAPAPRPGAQARGQTFPSRGAGPSQVRTPASSMSEIVREQRAFVDATAARMQMDLAAALREHEHDSAHPAPPPRPPVRAKAKSGEWIARQPAGVPLAPWSPRLSQFEVAGEFYRPDAFKILFKRHKQPMVGDGGELQLSATLVPDPENPYDPNAVAVFVDGLHVGYLEREHAKDYHRPIAELTQLGAAVTVRSRQWARASRGDVYARVTLMLPEPHGFQPANELPAAPHVVLPVGGPIQVTKEDQHMDVLSRFVGDRDLALAVTLHVITETRPRSTVDMVEARVDGERIGVLSPTQTANLKPLVDYVSARGRVPVARAMLVGNKLKADVTLYAAKAHDVDQAWLDGLGAPTAR